MFSSIENDNIKLNASKKLITP